MPTKKPKQTHARVFTGEIKPGQAAAATRVLNSEILPRVRKIKGFRDQQLMIKGNRFLWLTRWNECPGPGAIGKFSSPVLPYIRRLQHVRYAVSVRRASAARPVRRTVRRATVSKTASGRKR